MIVVMPSAESATALAAQRPRAQAFPHANPPLVHLEGTVGELTEDMRVLHDCAHPLSTFALHKERTEVALGDVVIGRDVVMIAGPCSVESTEQIIKAAHAVRSRGAHALRGGAYKPRTGPYAFQGHGESGLVMLDKARTQSGLPVVTEVMSPDTVEQVAKIADALQLGTRAMQNMPLLRAVGQTRLPVILKRGFGNSCEELLSAAEHILAAGNPNVILCERGVRSVADATRFTLDVSAVAWLKRESRLPVIVDPSHAAGRRDLVIPLALSALAAGADGLVVEVHPHPDEAWSDKAQALSPDLFSTLMEKSTALLGALGRRFAPHRPLKEVLP